MKDHSASSFCAALETYLPFVKLSNFIFLYDEGVASFL